MGFGKRKYGLKVRFLKPLFMKNWAFVIKVRENGFGFITILQQQLTFWPQSFTIFDGE